MAREKNAEFTPQTTMSIPVQSPKTAILLVDHGSCCAESNALLHDAAKRFRQQSNFQIVEPAHMELALPSIQQAFDRCVERGAKESSSSPGSFPPEDTGRKIFQNLFGTRPHITQVSRGLSRPRLDCIRDSLVQ
ncbi:MAG UNVERIFIED_CONTAM: hypothetical protein LVR18_26470 [Planctomycetaceae bacterium]|jgi:hypothetical protein